MPGYWWLAIAVSGGAGAGLRYLVDAKVSRRRQLPVGILIVNITGSFALGVTLALAPVLGPLAAIIGTGLLGGYTTLSTVSVDTAQLIEAKQWRMAAVNLLGTVVLATAAAALGFALTSSAVNWLGTGVS